MILTPIPDSELPESLVSFADSLSNDSFRSAFRRVVARGDPPALQPKRALRITQTLLIL